ncbi:MAG: type IV toxin-antitoxin system AbiEi family antitoxin [Sideroxyarcus sp.]|nr:type IV toxin-antitoxin system AbiEi family antitoxin [Sideroxyarcus sp.]
MARAPENPPAAEEQQILTQALEAFKQATAREVAVLKTEVRLPQGVADAEIRLANGERLLVEVKRNITPATLGTAVAQLARYGKPGMLVTGYINQQMAERLKALDVAFLDTAGNAYINTPKLFVYVTGRKPQAPAPREKRVRALRTTGLKVIFALLCRPDLVNAPYRDIAAAAGVALGTVGWVFYDLRRLGYITETKANGRVYADRGGLIDRWVEAYAHQLRPAIKPQRYRVADADWWKKENLAKFDMWLGGEPAAAVLTKYLRPEVVTVYGDTQFAALARKVKAVKDEYGNLEVLQKFWDFELPQADKQHPLVPPLLVYADLVATGDARNIETAQLVREQFLD